MNKVTTMQWTLYICMSNIREGKIGFDCSAISNVNILAPVFLPFLLSFLSVSYPLSLSKGINSRDVDFEHTDFHKNKLHTQLVVHKICAH